MSPRIREQITFMTLGLCFLANSGFSGPVPLRIAQSTNIIFLATDPLPSAGALFIFQAPDLNSLGTAPSVLFETNSAGNFLLSAPASVPTPAQSFFFAYQWPGRSASEFGSPEYAPAQAPPPLILITSGLPNSLSNGQFFTVDCFLTDPTGQVLPISGPVQFFVARKSDATLHPTARAVPKGAALDTGHLRTQISVQCGSSLAGYTLGLGPVTFGATNVAILLPALSLGTDPLSSPSSESLSQLLQSRRSAALDPDASWSFPLYPATSCQITGTYGEWRGKFNQEVHTGLDLAVPTNTPVLASRSGVVSCITTTSNLAGCVTIDHGHGSFTRYAGLDPEAIAVVSGQAVPVP